MGLVSSSEEDTRVLHAEGREARSRIIGVHDHLSSLAVGLLECGGWEPSTNEVDNRRSKRS